MVEEFVPAPGLRVDVMALGPRGEIWVAECKSSRADFTSDAKWAGYLEWGDRYFWAVDEAFPTDLLPEGTAPEMVRLSRNQLSRWKNDLLTPEEAIETAEDAKALAQAQLYARYQIGRASCRERV